MSVFHTSLVLYLLSCFPPFIHSHLQWTWSWCCSGVLPCLTAVSEQWPPVSPPSGFVSSSSARCCTSSVSSTLQSTPTTAPWWDSTPKHACLQTHFMHYALQVFFKESITITIACMIWTKPESIYLLKYGAAYGTTQNSILLWLFHENALLFAL